MFSLSQQCTGSNNPIGDIMEAGRWKKDPGVADSSAWGKGRG